MKYSIAGMDIGTEETKICIIEIDTKDHTEHVVGFFKYRTEGLHRGYIMNEKTFKQSLGKIINDLGKILGSRIDTVAISLGSSHIESAILGQQCIITKADNEVTHFDIENLEKTLEESILEKTKKLLYSSIVETKIDGKIAPSRPEGMRGVKLDMKKLFIQIATKDYELYEDAFFDNDIELVMAYPKGITASIQSLTEKQKMVGVGYLDIGAETTVLTVYENGGLIGYTCIPYGSNDITNDIALGLKISLEEAEEIKRGMGSKIVSKKKLDDIIYARLDDIAELANNYLKKIKKDELLPGGIILAGGGTEIVTIEEYFREALNLPAKKVTCEIPTARKGVVRNTEFIECYGVAMQYKNSEFRAQQKKTGTVIDKIKKNGSSFFKQFLP